MASKKQKLEIADALFSIIGFVDRHRARGWHVYPTRLRDRAVRALVDAGYEVEDYDVYEKRTDGYFDGKGGEDE